MQSCKVKYWYIRICSGLFPAYTVNLVRPAYVKYRAREREAWKPETGVLIAREIVEIEREKERSGARAREIRRTAFQERREKARDQSTEAAAPIRKFRSCLCNATTKLGEQNSLELDVGSAELIERERERESLTYET